MGSGFGTYTLSVMSVSFVGSVSSSLKLLRVGIIKSGDLFCFFIPVVVN